VRKDPLVKPAVRDFRISPRAIAPFLLVALLFSGCGFWRNFTTYFNTLYLAEWHLAAYEDQLASQPAASSGAAAVLSHRWLDEEYETRQAAMRAGRSQKIQESFAPSKNTPRGSGSATHLDSAIILGSKILANKKDTKYLEDALFVVGKAQYYKNDFAGSKRKFLELLTRYPDTKYGSQVQMLLARSMLNSNQLDTAALALSTAVKEAEAANDKRTLADAHRAYAELIFAKNADSLTAVEEELKLSEQNLQGLEASRLAYELGCVQYLDGKWAEAEATFQRSITNAKDDNLEGEARIAHALALRRIGKFDEARAELNFVVSKSRFSNAYPTARYELAYTTELAARAAVNEDLRSDAFRQNGYPEVKNAYFVVDTSLRSTSQAIVSRSKYRQAELLRAMGEFDTASRYATPLVGTKDFSTSQMNDYVSDRMRALAHFAGWRNDLAHLDTVEAQVKRAKVNASLPGAEEKQIRSEALKEVLGVRWLPDREVPLTKDDDLKLEQVEMRLRKERAQHNALASLGIKDTTVFIDSLHFQQAKLHFELARAYENFGDVPKARAEYMSSLAIRYVLPDTTKDLFRAQDVYAWLQLESGEKNTARRDSLLQELTSKYGETIYARQAMTLYGGPRQKDSPGELAYKSAYGVLHSSGIEPAKPPLLNIVAQYPHEDVAARSLFALGVFYEEGARYDSALHYYKIVLGEYPYSSYADVLRPRLADAGSLARPQTARRIEPKEVKSEEEKQREEIERIRHEHEQQLKEEELRAKQGGGMPGETPGMPPAPIPGSMSSPPSDSTHGPNNSRPLRGNVPPLPVR
jgi:TolA-binding protein